MWSISGVLISLGLVAILTTDIGYGQEDTCGKLFCLFTNESYLSLTEIIVPGSRYCLLLVNILFIDSYRVV
jgi:hypothetical protein